MAKIASSSRSPSPSISSTQTTDEGPASNSNEPRETIQVGMTSTARSLYRRDSSEPWQEWAPDDISSPARPDSAKFALIVRHERRLGDTGEPTLALHSIRVQSPLLKQLLGPVFAGYEGISTNLKKLEFHAPFQEFFHKWKEFIEAEPSHDEGDVDKTHYKLLADLITAEIRPHIEQVRDLEKNHFISFDYLWALFPPGTEVYSKADGHDRLYLLDRSSYRQRDNIKIYTLSCRYIDTNGEAFGYKRASFDIVQFQGVKPTLGLDVVPSHLQPGIDVIRKQLSERGRVFELLKGIHHKLYSGAYDLALSVLGAPRKQYVSETFLSTPM